MVLVIVMRMGPTAVVIAVRVDRSAVVIVIVIATVIVFAGVRTESVSDLRQRGFEVLELFRAEHVFDPFADAVAQVAESLTHLFGIDVLRRPPVATGPWRTECSGFVRVRGTIWSYFVTVPAATSAPQTAEVPRAETIVGCGRAEFAAKGPTDLAQQLRQIGFGL